MIPFTESSVLSSANAFKSPSKKEDAPHDQDGEREQWKMDINYWTKEEEEEFEPLPIDVYSFPSHRTNEDPPFSNDNANIATTKTETSTNSAAYPASPSASTETQGYYYNHPFGYDGMVDSHSSYNLDHMNHWYGHNGNWHPFPYYDYVDAQRSGDSQRLQYSYSHEPHYSQPLPHPHQNCFVQRSRSDYFHAQVTDSPYIKQENFKQLSATYVLHDQNNTNDSNSIPYAPSNEDKENSSFENIGTSNSGTKKRKMEEDALKPRNALSAYNFFFMEEKELIVALLNAENDVHMKQTDTTDKSRSSTISEMNVDEINAHVAKLLEAVDEVKLRQLKEPVEEKTANFLKIHYEAHREKRSHKKRHGLISFLDLAKVIGIRWRSLSQDAKKRYFDLAREDRLRFSKMG